MGEIRENTRLAKNPKELHLFIAILPFSREITDDKIIINQILAPHYLYKRDLFQSSILNKFSGNPLPI